MIFAPVPAARQGCSHAPSGVKSFCVVMPARDEYPTVGDLVRRIRALHACEVVVVDDASVDGTGQAARQAGATVLRMAERAGAWRAAQAGLAHALARGYRVVVTFDADGQHLPETIPRILRGVERGGADVCVGSCPGRAGPLKKAAWAALRRLSGSGVRDVTSGLRAYNRRAALSLLGEEAAGMDYQDVGVLMLLADGGFRVDEVEVPMRRREHGRSRQFGAVTDMVRHFVKSALYCLRFRRGGRLAGGAPYAAASRSAQARPTQSRPASVRPEPERASRASLSSLSADAVRAGRSG